MPIRTITQLTVFKVGKYGDPLDSGTNHKVSADEFQQHIGNVLEIEKDNKHPIFVV